MAPTPLPHIAPTEPGSGANRIGLIQSCWHRDIVDQCRDAFLLEMENRGHPRDLIDLHEVPGAFEIPLLAARLARTGRYVAIAATGLVVDGGIYRHEFVADAVISGLMRVQLDTEIPVLTAVLTPQHFHEHEDHRRFFFDHFAIKGKELAAACAATVANHRALSSSS